MSLESAYSTIEKLVNDFKANERHYLAADYSESQARLDFIDKLFIALGWDVNHEHQKNPYEQEVKVERRVKDKETQKRADYAFFLEPNYRDPKFYVEAKKPSRSLANQYDYFQAIRYGWNAGTPLVVLTDFEEFHILDSRYKPDIKYTTQRKILRFHYTEYTDKEKFAKLYYLFSREAVGNGSIEKFAEDLPKPRGKAVQKGLFPGAYQSIDESFLEELDEIRNTLARSFKKKNPSLTSEELTEATQRTIDRLVFIRFLEDMLIEGEHHISSYGDKGTAWGDFITDCRSLNAKYNGIVFKEHFIDRLPLTKGEIQRGSKTEIAPDDKDFAQICEELSHINTPYNFNSIPIHILGSIYERFLGKVVHATDKRVTIEEKPEVRKAGGVYYTPQYIVKYIVDNTVGKLIEGKTPAEISKLRFADISCGSGSFLITVYDTLLRYHSKYYQLNHKEAKSDGCIFSNGLWVLSLKQKRQILLNNVYGVDIDHQAVEVTQLSLYLKLLEDETLATANEMQAMFKEKILPDLSKNIICGNSLIGTHIYDGNMFPSDEEKKINAMNFSERFPEIIKNGGFDAIVGNPPYLKMTVNNINKELLKYYQINYKTLSSGSSKNLFQMFIERALSITKNRFSYIIPEALLTTESNKILRDLLNNDSVQTKTVVTFNHFVFQEATIGTAIIVASKTIDNVPITYLIMDNEGRIISKTTTERKSIGNIWLRTSNKEYDTLLNKISLNNKYLSDICEMSKGMVVKDRKEVLEFIKTKNNLPFLLGNSMQRYMLEYKFFAEYSKLNIIGGTRKFDKHMHVPRLLLRRTGNYLCVTYSDNKELIESTLYILTSSDIDLKYLLGILNSTLLSFYLKKGLITNAQGFPQVLMSQLNKLPIVIPHKDNTQTIILQEKIIQLVNQILESKKHLHSVKTDKDKAFYENKCNSLDHQIDRLVYELYGLTEEEIKIVEGE